MAAAAMLFAGCSTTVTELAGSGGSGGSAEGGAPGKGGHGGSTTSSGGAPGDGGSGGSTTSSGGAMPGFCGYDEFSFEEIYCERDEVCFSCTSDDEDEGEISWCREEPVVGPDEFRCFFGACKTSTEYCNLVIYYLCDGDYFQSCGSLDDACQGAAPSCDCFANDPCVFSCSGSAETGLTVEVYDFCDPTRR